MQSLTQVYEKVAAKDADLEKQAAELVKQAEEEDAAGRIMARGFVDELAKLAGSFQPELPGSFKAGPVDTSGGKTGQNYSPAMKPHAQTAAANNPLAGKPQPMPKPAAGGAAPKPAAAPKPMGGPSVAMK